jgi:trimeric autotransporter adhesin
MASINASTSGAGGLITTGDSSGALDIQTAGTTAIAISSAQVVTVQGVTIGRGAGAVSSNTVLGASAGASNTTGDQNTFIGQEAGFTNSTGAENTFVGRRVGYASTGSANTGVGTIALRFNTSGVNNTGLGYGALYANTTAAANTAVGFQAAYNVTTRSAITAVGFQSLYSTTTGGDACVAVGYRALYSNTTGNYNTGIGYGTLNTNTTGTSNSALGLNALYNNTTGGFNTAIGHDCLFNNTTSSGATALGYQAGFTHTTASDCTYIGVQAGYSTNGNGNTFVGVSAGYNITSGSKNTIIGRYNGNQNGLDIRTLSNRIVLSDGDGNPRQVIDNNGTSKLKQYLVSNNKKDAVASGVTTELFRLDSPTGQIYGNLTIQFGFDQPGINFNAGTITGRCFWNGSTALFDGTSTTGSTLTWSVTGSGNQLTFRVAQATGGNVNFAYTVIWNQYQTGGLNGVDTTTIIGL